MNNKRKLTPALRKRVHQSIRETRAIISKEMKYSKGLRNKKYLRTHFKVLNDLKKMLKTGYIELD